LAIITAEVKTGLFFATVYKIWREKGRDRDFTR